MSPKSSPPSYETALYKKIEVALPSYVERGRLKVRKLAKDLEVSGAAAYRWFKNNRLTPAAAKKLIDISNGSLTPTDLVEFIVES